MCWTYTREFSRGRQKKHSLGAFEMLIYSRKTLKLYISLECLVSFSKLHASVTMLLKLDTMKFSSWRRIFDWWMCKASSFHKAQSFFIWEQNHFSKHYALLVTLGGNKLNLWSLKVVIYIYKKCSAEKKISEIFSTSINKRST